MSPNLRDTFYSLHFRSFLLRFWDIYFHLNRPSYSYLWFFNIERKCHLILAYIISILVSTLEACACDNKVLGNELCLFVFRISNCYFTFVLHLHFIKIIRFRLICLGGIRRVKSHPFFGCDKCFVISKSEMIITMTRIQHKFILVSIPIRQHLERGVLKELNSSCNFYKKNFPLRKLYEDTKTLWNKRGHCLSVKKNLFILFILLALTVIIKLNLFSNITYRACHVTVFNQSIIMWC